MGIQRAALVEAPPRPTGCASSLAGTRTLGRTEIATPNIDALAGDGIRFRQFDNTAVCFPTRACLMTGIYAQQNGFVGSPRSFLRESATGKMWIPTDEMERCYRLGFE